MFHILTYLPLSVKSFSPLFSSHFPLCLCELVKMVKPDIHTLAHHLKQERLYVASEKQLIQRLNSDVLKTAERLYRAAWIAKQQRINLDRLILTRSDLPSCFTLGLQRHIYSKPFWEYCTLTTFLFRSEMTTRISYHLSVLNMVLNAQCG